MARRGRGPWVLACAVALGAFAVLAHTSAQAQSPSSTFGNYAPAARYAEVVDSSFYLTMRDGVKIAVHLRRPAQAGRTVEGKFPVLWTGALDLPPPESGPIDNNAFGARPDWHRLVRQGYVLATIARRGNGSSFGVQRGYQDRQEAYDAYEITEWLAAQPWSTGAVGVYGCSNTGEAAMHAYSIAPPHLKAVWAGCFSWSKYDGFLRGGGIIANWGAGPTRTLEENLRARPVETDKDGAMLRQAAEEHLKNTNLSELLQSLPYRDSLSPLTNTRFAYEGSVATYKAQVLAAKIPLYIQGGWGDDFRREMFVTFANVPNTRVLIGPWGHCLSDGFDTVREAQRFFDYHLKGIDTGIAADDPIHYFTIGAAPGQEWKAAKTWAGQQSPGKALYLSPRRGLQASPPARGAVTLAVDYDSACQNGQGAQAMPCHPQRGAVVFNQRLAADLTLTGHTVIDLWITSSAPDANLFAYLEDVAPDGSIKVISDARQRASLRKVSDPPYDFLGLPYHRGYKEDAEPLSRDVPARVQFDFLPTSYVVKAGHRLQVAIAGADPRERFRAIVTSAPTIQILTGGDRASRLVLPPDAKAM